MRSSSKRAALAESIPVGSESQREASGLQRRIRADLLRRGVAVAVAGPIAERIVSRAEGLDPVRYAVLLDGAAAAHAVDPEVAGPVSAPAPAEMQRIVQDFAVELKKLDEGLRLLSTYLLRIRDRASGGEDHTVH